MSYRINEHPHHHGRRTMHDAATPMLISVHNGATAHLAIPVWYQEIQKPIRARHHNVHWHHHVGWPSPNHPDHICQLAYEGVHYGHKCPHGHEHCRQTCSHYIDMTQMIPVHLLKEGYNPTPRIEFARSVQGLSHEAWIDPLEDWVVRVMFAPGIQEAIDEVANVRFSVFVDAPAKTDKKIDAISGEEKEFVHRERKDVVAHGLLRVLPSPF